MYILVKETVDSNDITTTELLACSESIEKLKTYGTNNQDLPLESEGWQESTNSNDNSYTIEVISTKNFSQLKISTLPVIVC